MNAVAAVIFDMDGLMVDTEAMAIDVWQEAAQAEGVEISRELCIGMIGLNQRDSEQLIIDTLGADFPLARVSGRFLNGLRDRLDSGRIDAKPGLIPLLDYLDAQGIPKAVATSSGRPEMEKKLRAIGVLSRFPVIVTSDRVKRGKPAPDLFLLAAAELRVAPSRCTVLEDSEAGIRAAHAAGMRAFMVPDIKQPSDAVAEMASDIFSSLTDVRQFLTREQHAQAHSV